MQYDSQKYTFYANWISVHDFYEHTNSVYPDFLFISEKNKQILHPIS